MNSLAFLISIYFLILLSGFGFWDQIKRINNVSSKWESYQSWKEWNADESWKFEESSCKSIKVWPTFHTPYLYGKNEALTSKDYILKHNSNLTEMIFKNGEGSCITKDCEWRVISVDKMLFEIEIKRDPEINEELIIIAVSDNKVKTFEPKQLSSWTFEPLKLNKSIFGIESNMGLEAEVGLWRVTESIFDTFWRQISNCQSFSKNVHAISKLLACQYSDSSFLDFSS